MDKIYEDLKDLHVKSTYIYEKGDGKAYVDSGCTVKYKTSELKEAFLKGAIVRIAGGFAYPIRYTESSGIGTVAFIKPNTSTATSADIVSLVSVADA